MITIKFIKNHLKCITKLMQLCMFIIIISIHNSVVATAPTLKINFWNIQQKGANIFNQNVTADDIQAAQQHGFTFIRLAPDKFTSLHRDFLIGNADDYQGLIPEDLDHLKRILNLCAEKKMPVVITMLSLPGSRWKQNNNNIKDLKIWTEEKYQDQATRFWQDLATALKDHPAIVGYNLLNEPYPERIFPFEEEHTNSAHQKESQKILFNLYSRIIKHIRLIDTDTPIILDSSRCADAKRFRLLTPQQDANVLYSFHMYEPHHYTIYAINQGKYQYPGHIDGKKWNKRTLKQHVSEVSKFQKKYSISSNKILVGEFGGHRKLAGLDQYFKDLITIFNKKHWHFAIYAFREDTWDGMDYELRGKKLPWSYW